MACVYNASLCYTDSSGVRAHGLSPYNTLGCTEALSYGTINLSLNRGEIMFEAHLLVTAILLACSLAFRLAGAKPLLNTIDYRIIGDAGQFNRYVGTRMLLPTVVAACCTGITYWNPALGVPLIFAIPLAVLCVVVWVGVGSKKFAIGADGRGKSAA